MGFMEFMCGKKCEICKDKRTQNILDDGRTICESCELDLKMKAEKKIKCPICNKFMMKEDVEGIIIDRCKEHGVWLDKGELKELREKIEDDCDNGGSSFAVGLACGSAI
jgi:hypothetical protein